MMSFEKFHILQIPTNNLHKVATSIMTYLAISMPLAQLGLFRVVEPLDFDHHTGGPGFPEVLNSTNVWEVRTSS